MNGILGRDSLLQDYTGPGTVWSKEINFNMNDTPGAELTARPIDLYYATINIALIKSNEMDTIIQ